MSGARAQSVVPAGSPPPAERHILRLESPEPGIAFHLLRSSIVSHVAFRFGGRLGAARTEIREFEALCQTPCEVSLRSGVYTFALSRPGGSPVSVLPPLDLDRDVRLAGVYVDNSGLRAAGVTTMVLGVLASGAIIGPSATILSNTPLDDSVNRDLGNGLLVGGLAVFALTFAIGLGLGLREDGGRIEF